MNVSQSGNPGPPVYTFNSSFSRMYCYLSPCFCFTPNHVHVLGFHIEFCYSSPARILYLLFSFQKSECVLHTKDAWIFKHLGYCVVLGISFAPAVLPECLPRAPSWGCALCVCFQEASPEDQLENCPSCDLPKQRDGRCCFPVFSMKSVQ